MQLGSRIIFVGYGHRFTDQDEIFERGNFGIVAAIDDDGIPLCFLSDECGKAIWWQPQTLFPEEFVLLNYAPPVARERIPVPYGDLVGQPW